MPWKINILWRAQKGDEQWDRPWIAISADLGPMSSHHQNYSCSKYMAVSGQQITLASNSAQAYPLSDVRQI